MASENVMHQIKIKKSTLFMKQVSRSKQMSDIHEADSNDEKIILMKLQYKATLFLQKYFMGQLINSLNQSL